MLRGNKGTNKRQRQNPSPKDSGMAETLSTSLTPVESKGGLVTVLGMSKEDLAVYAGAMQDNISSASVRHARLAIVQTNTPEVSDGMPGYKAGMLMTNTEKQVLSNYIKMPWLLGTGINADEVKHVHCLQILPIFKLPDEYIAWISRKERKEGDGLWHWKSMVRSKEVLQGLPDWRGGKWKKSDTQPSPPVTENCNVLFVPLTQDGEFLGGPIVASFSRTSFKTGEKLVNACAQHLHMKLPWWGRTYWLYTEPKENELGKFHVMRFARGQELIKLPSWQEKHQICLDTCRMLADPTKSEVEDGKGGFKSMGRVRQEQLISAAIIVDEDEGGSDTTDDFVTDHFAGESGGAGEAAF